MNTLADVKAFLLREYNWVHAQIAVHPYLSVLGAAILGNVVGVVLHV